MSTTLQAIIFSETQIPKGFTGSILKNHTVINLLEFKSILVIPQIKIPLPPHFDYLRLSFKAENGTSRGKNRSGFAKIACDLNGLPLKSFSPIIIGDEANRAGYTNVSSPFVYITIDRLKSDYRICMYEVSFRPLLSIKTLISYSGTIPFPLPIHLSQYQTALNAGISKSHCYKCNCFHFYEQNHNPQEDNS
jgi:hypothetical protein